MTVRKTIHLSLDAAAGNIPNPYIGKGLLFEGQRKICGESGNKPSHCGQRQFKKS